MFPDIKTRIFKDIVQPQDTGYVHSQFMNSHGLDFNQLLTNTCEFSKTTQIYKP